MTEHEDEIEHDDDQEFDHEHEELMVLKHDALPGYMTKFNIAFALGIIYLAIVFIFDKG